MQFPRRSFLASLISLALVPLTRKGTPKVEPTKIKSSRPTTYSLVAHAQMIEDAEHADGYWGRIVGDCVNYPGLYAVAKVVPNGKGSWEQLDVPPLIVSEWKGRDASAAFGKVVRVVGHQFSIGNPIVAWPPAR